MSYIVPEVSLTEVERYHYSIPMSYTRGDFDRGGTNRLMRSARSRMIIEVERYPTPYTRSARSRMIIDHHSHQRLEKI